MATASNYDMAMRIMDGLVVSRPVSIQALSEHTGYTHAVIMQSMLPLVSAGVVMTSRDRDNIYYILLTSEYASHVADVYRRNVSGDSRYAVGGSSETSARRSGFVRSLTGGGHVVRSPTGEEVAVATAGVRRRVVQPEADAVQDSATSSENVRRLSADTNKRVGRSQELSYFDRKYSQQLTANAIPSRQIPLSGSFKRVVTTGTSSSSHKAVYINNNTSTRTQSASSSRSMYAVTPPQSFNPNALRRTDTNLPVKASIEKRPQTPPLLSFRPNAQSGNEFSEAALRKKLGLGEAIPLVTLAADKPCFDVWAAFSAVANVGGGVILMGVRRHGISYFVKSMTRAAEVQKALLRGFADTNNISDAPKTENFVRVEEMGRKKFILIEVDVSLLEKRPVFTSTDSFGTRINDGCYTLKENCVVRCTTGETKALWEKCLEGDTPDWAQEGDILPVEMKSRAKLSASPEEADGSRLSNQKRSEKVAARPMARPKPPRRWEYESPAKRKDAAPRGRGAYGAEAKKGGRADEASVRFSAPAIANTQPPLFSYARDAQTIDGSAKSALSERLARRSKMAIDEARHQNATMIKGTPSSQEVNEAIVHQLLLADDIRPVRKINKPLQTHAIAEVFNPGVPPVYDASMREEFDALSEGAIRYARLPAGRLCEIASRLCRRAQLTQEELAEILCRTMQVIKKTIIPKLSEDPKFRCVNKRYFYID